MQLKLACDSSSYGVGVVLSHVFPNEEERPIVYGSRVLSKAERNYSCIEREALSIIFGVKKFNQYLYGNHFVLSTDHNPLLAIFGKKKVFLKSQLIDYKDGLTLFQGTVMI